MRPLIALLLLAISSLASRPASADGLELLNVSYDPTREFYAEVNTAFAAQWKAKTGPELHLQDSHGGSGK